MPIDDEKDAAKIVERSMLGMIAAQGLVLSLLIGALEDSGTLMPGIVLERLGLSLNSMKTAIGAAGKADDPQQRAIAVFVETLYASMSDFDRRRRGAKTSG